MGTVRVRSATPKGSGVIFEGYVTCVDPLEHDDGQPRTRTPGYTITMGRLLMAHASPSRLCGPAQSLVPVRVLIFAMFRAPLKRQWLRPRSGISLYSTPSI